MSIGKRTSTTRPGDTGVAAGGVSPARKRGRRRGYTQEIGRADARRALRLRREGLSYLQIGARLGCSESHAWRLVQRALADRADPRALRAAIKNCEEMLRSGANLDVVLLLQAKLRALCSAVPASPTGTALGIGTGNWLASLLVSAAL